MNDGGSDKGGVDRGGVGKGGVDRGGVGKGGGSGPCPAITAAADAAERKTRDGR
ncbi:hypothetical protein ABT112_18070 [Streptomyces sp. NPDC002055]|uniref:hypothetical protein n=1 Tax=Streptomyces sp. NPDC002055 TaxID=3154534 RepID=UPI00332C631B